MSSFGKLPCFLMRLLDGFFLGMIPLRLQGCDSETRGQFHNSPVSTEDTESGHPPASGTSFLRSSLVGSVVHSGRRRRKRAAIHTPTSQSSAFGRSPHQGHQVVSLQLLIDPLQACELLLVQLASNELLVVLLPLQELPIVISRPRS